jgi:hypothetical protein
MKTTTTHFTGDPRTKVLSRSGNDASTHHLLSSEILDVAGGHSIARVKSALVAGR